MHVEHWIAHVCRRVVPWRKPDEDIPVFLEKLRVKLLVTVELAF